VTGSSNAEIKQVKGPTGQPKSARRISVYQFPGFLRSSKGFTLLELMIVITIIVILAAIALPRFQAVVIHAREATLRDDLFQMRKAIDQYAADKGKLPQSLDDLASSQYLREVPVDPFTGEKDWQQVTGEDPASIEGGQGLTDVHSASPESSADGTSYAQW
jgi:general secretion pathway protein G